MPSATLPSLSLVDEYLPTYDISDAVATIVSADVATRWNALMELDLIEVGHKRPAVAVLGAVRALPDLIDQLPRGEKPVPPPRPMRLRDTTAIRLGEGGWVLLGERPNDEIALGLLGKFWRPVIKFAKRQRRRVPGFFRTRLCEDHLVVVRSGVWMLAERYCRR